jgi:hypothetical protein
MEFPTFPVQALGAKLFIETVGGIGRLAEEQHRRNTSVEEATCHIAQQEPAEALPVASTQHVNLVQSPRETRHAPIVRRALGKTDEFASVILDDEAEPAPVVDCERFAPLAFP